MKRITYDRYGGPNEMRLASFEPSTPDKGEILVQVRAASINPFDWKLRQGAIKIITGRKFPRAMGSDFSGVVERVGAGVTEFQPGDEVLGTTPVKSSGAFAEALITKETLIIKKPASLTFEQAAALPTAGVTAWRALVVIGKVKSGSSVFLNGVMGAVGQASICIARDFGAFIAGRVNSAAFDQAKSLGVDPVLDYTKEIPEKYYGKFDLVFDCNGSLTPGVGNKLVNSKGVVIDINPSMAKMALAMLPNRRKILFNSPSTKILAQIANLAATGKFEIPIGRVVTLGEAITLIGELEAGGSSAGKSIIRIFPS